MLNIRFHIGPHDADRADLIVCSLFTRSMHKPGIPRRGNNDRPAVVEFDGDSFIGDIHRRRHYVIEFTR